MCEIIRGEMCEGRNVPLDLRGVKCVWGETWDILKGQSENSGLCPDIRAVLLH